MREIKPVILPKDNGPHNFVVEWWYFNGHLKDVEGREYSFMDCFFKVDISKVNIPHLSPGLIKDIFKKNEYVHFAHSVVTDIKKGKSHKEIQNISFVSEDSFSKDLLYIDYHKPNIFGYNSKGKIIEITPNNFHIQNNNLNLVLISKKKPLLEGGHGYVGTPRDGSYYYSFTDMKASGSINVGGKDIDVYGKAWMDHQWADVSYKGKSDKWTWFSFQLDNGTEIMCVEYDREEGSDILIDMVDKYGHQTQYKKANFIPLNKHDWKSKKTKAIYPLSWRIEIINADIVIHTEAESKDQEMIFGQINYWEGPMKVIAFIDGKKVKGKGYMELVGYPSDYNYLLLEGKETEKDILKRIKKLYKKI